MLKDNKLLQLIQSLDSKIKKVDELILIGPLKFPKSDLVDCKLQIYVDNGIKHTKKKRGVISIGDGDSSGQKMMFALPVNKDFSDLAEALKLIQRKNIKIYLRGFLPLFSIEKRFDHLLANLGEAYLHSKKYKSTLNFSENIRIYPKGIHHLEFNSDFSIIIFEKTKIQLIGKIKYKLHNGKFFLPLTSHLISNQANGKFKLECSRPVLLVRY